jgi:carbon-monoxide dehydrogenase medium subunit
MKPAPFTYHRPSSLEEALRLLAAHDNARPLAGGQSLIPMMNFRLVAPDHVIDLNRISELATIRAQENAIAFGAMVRQRDVEYSTLVAERIPLLAEAVREVGHRQTRNRGTFGGSLCQLDPSAELPTVAMAMDAELMVRSARAERIVPMAQFVAGYLTTSLAPDELLCEIRLTLWPAGHGYAFIEFARRKGDFAIVSVATLIALDGAGKVARAAIALGGLQAAPVRLSELEASLAGMALTGEAIKQCAARCAGLTALSDPSVPSWYRQHLATVLVERALATALGRARYHAGAGTGP